MKLLLIKNQVASLKFLVPIALGIGLSFSFAQPSHAIKFSLMGWEAEQSVKNCVFDDSTEFDPVINMGFWGGRSVIFALFVWNYLRGSYKKNNGQDGDENFKTIGFMIAAIFVVGLVEPVFADAGCGAGGGGGDGGGGEETYVIPDKIFG